MLVSDDMMTLFSTSVIFSEVVTFFREKSLGYFPKFCIFV